MTSKRAALQPPAHLSERAKQLWNAIVPGRAASPGRLALLQVALEALDRADEAAALIRRDGLVLAGEGKIAHVHPAARVEKDARGDFQRAWAALRLEWDGEIDARGSA